MKGVGRFGPGRGPLGGIVAASFCVSIRERRAENSKSECRNPKQIRRNAKAGKRLAAHLRFLPSRFSDLFRISGVRSARATRDSAFCEIPRAGESEDAPSRDAGCGNGGEASTGGWSRRCWRGCRTGMISSSMFDPPEKRTQVAAWLGSALAGRRADFTPQAAGDLGGRLERRLRRPSRGVLKRSRSSGAIASS